MFQPGPTEIIIILLIVLLLFGARKIPQIGESLGKGIMNFKNALQGKDTEQDTQDKQDNTNTTKE